MRTHNVQWSINHKSTQPKTTTVSTMINILLRLLSLPVTKLWMLLTPHAQVLVHWLMKKKPPFFFTPFSSLFSHAHNELLRMLSRSHDRLTNSTVNQLALQVVMHTRTDDGLLYLNPPKHLSCTHAYLTPSFCEAVLSVSFFVTSFDAGSFFPWSPQHSINQHTPSRSASLYSPSFSATLKTPSLSNSQYIPSFSSRRNTPHFLRHGLIKAAHRATGITIQVTQTISLSTAPCTSLWSHDPHGPLYRQYSPTSYSNLGSNRKRNTIYGRRLDFDVSRCSSQSYNVSAAPLSCWKVFSLPLMSSEWLVNSTINKRTSFSTNIFHVNVSTWNTRYKWNTCCFLRSYKSLLKKTESKYVRNCYLALSLPYLHCPFVATFNTPVLSTLVLS